MSVPILQSNVRNRLLQALAPADFSLLAPHLTYRPLPLRSIVEGPDSPNDGAMFFESGICSSVVVGQEGDLSEVGHIGREGMSGRHILHCAPLPSSQMMVQVPGSALRIDAAPLTRALDRSASLRGLLLRYLQSVDIQLAHSMLAVTRFNVHQRLARWLLMCHDRIDSNDLPLTHDILARMLSVRRASVTQEIQMLEGLGAVRAMRGNVRILDRSRLIAITAGSYGIPEAEYERLIQPPCHADRRSLATVD